MSEIIIERLKSTAQIVGQLYPVLVNKNGDIIDGAHRLIADPSWKRVELDLNPLKTHIFRLVSNSIRRTTDNRDYDELAGYLQKTEPGDKPSRVASGKSIAERISELTSIPERTIYEHLDQRFKDPVKSGAVSATELGIGEQVRIPIPLVRSVRGFVHRVRVKAGEHPENVGEIIHAVTEALDSKTIVVSTCRIRGKHEKSDGLRLAFVCTVCGAKLTAAPIHYGPNRHALKVILGDAEK
jgi:hypothetical protein